MRKNIFGNMNNLSNQFFLKSRPFTVPASHPTALSAFSMFQVIIIGLGFGLLVRHNKGLQYVIYGFREAINICHYCWTFYSINDQPGEIMNYGCLSWLVNSVNFLPFVVLFFSRGWNDISKNTYLVNTVIEVVFLCFFGQISTWTMPNLSNLFK